MGSGIPRGPVPDVLFPRTSDNTPSQIGVDRVNDGIMMEGVKDQITRVLREFGFSPKGWARVYEKPYPHGFRVPDFAKFNGDDNKTIFKHIGQFLAQVNDVGVTPPS
jgi:hypothetical protein